MPLTLALERKKLKDFCEFEASLDYSAKIHRETVSKK